MSKTSSRKAAKKRNRERRGLFATHSVVGYEQHAAVLRELERVSAVLADLIEEQKGAAVPARQVVAWVKNPELVRAVFDGSDDFYDCPHCDVQRGGAHYRTCVLAMAWHATGHSHAERNLLRGWSEALTENNRRTVGKKQLRFPRRPNVEMSVSEFVPPGTAYLMNPAAFAMPPVSSPHRPSLFNIPPATYELWRGNVVPPRTLAGRMEQANQLVRLGETDPAEYLRIVGTPPASENWRREYLGEFPAALDNSTNPSSGPDYERWVSDNRGLDVVEAEARAHHIDLMLNRIGFPQS